MTTMFQNWKVAQEEQTGQELVLNQVSDMKKHIGEVEKLYQDICSLRHDMGNHIQMLEHLVAENHMDDAAEYMEHLKKEWNEISPEIKTGSPVIDVILMEKLREAKEKQIRFISDFHYPGDTKLNAFDLSVILNNALDNLSLIHISFFTDQAVSDMVESSVKSVVQFAAGEDTPLEVH